MLACPKSSMHPVAYPACHPGSCLSGNRETASPPPGPSVTRFRIRLGRGAGQHEERSTTGKGWWEFSVDGGEESKPPVRAGNHPGPGYMGSRGFG